MDSRKSATLKADLNPIAVSVAKLAIFATNPCRSERENNRLAEVKSSGGNSSRVLLPIDRQLSRHFPTP